MRRHARVVALFLLAVACARESPGTGGQTPFLAADNATRAPLLPTNAFALPDLDLAGYQRLLEQLRGTPVYVNVWGSWCPPCRQEAPFIADAHARYGDRVQFLGIDILDSRESAREFMREFGWSHPSVFDLEGEIRDELGYIGQPVSIFYDAQGEVVADFAGPLSEALLDKYLRRLVS
jgi:thiol-disulfide isomerase/thioredoxin